MSQKERNEGLDALKFVAAILVCCQHAITGVGLWGYFLAFTRIAVPVFFMVTGFYAENIKLKKYLSKIIKIIIEMTLLYFFFDIIQAILKGNVSNYLEQFIDSGNLINFVLFNDPIIADHGWYLFALVYALPCVVFLIRNKKLKILMVLGIIGIACLMFFGKYSLLLLGKEIPSTYTRCWFTVGIPFLAIGYFLKCYMGKKSKYLDLMILITLFMNIIERFLLVKNGYNATRDMYLCTIILAVLVFKWFWCNGSIFRESCIAEWGRKYSLIIYIVHPLFIRYLKVAFNIVGLNNEHLINILTPCIIIVCSIVTAIIIVRVEHFIKVRRDKFC